MTSTSSHLEVVLAVNNTEAIDVWDIHSGAHLKSLNVQADNICFLDDNYFVLTQNGPSL
jgi:hypothetical protein